MEVLKPSDGLLTNAEVYELINQNKKQRPAQYSLDNGAKVESKLPSSHYLSLQNREFVENETLNYLKQTNTNLNSEAIKLFIRKLKQLDVHLTETELVQLANHQPSFPVEVHIVIDECYSRLTADQIEEIIELSTECKEYSSNIELANNG